MKAKIFQMTTRCGRPFVHGILLCLGLVVSTTQASAKPTPLSFHSDLNYLVSALETYHPNPWQSRKRQGFRQDLTYNPEILNTYPVGPMLNISRSLKKLDNKQQDAVTGLNLFEQQVAWKMLPIEFVIINGQLYIASENSDFTNFKHKRVTEIGGVTPSQLIRTLTRYFPGRDRGWFANYLRVTDILHYFGSRCRKQCSIKLAGGEQIELLHDSYLSVEQAQPAKTFLIDRFITTKTIEERILRENNNSLRWILYGNGLTSSVLFDEMAANIRGMIRDRGVQNLILDLRGIQKTDPILERRFLDIAKEFLKQNVHRKLYAFIDNSTGPVLFSMLHTLDNMSEVSFVGESTDLALATYHDPQMIELPNSKISIGIARRYERLLGVNRPEQRFLPDEEVVWSAADYFAGRDSLLDATMVLIELAEVD